MDFSTVKPAFLDQRFSTQTVPRPVFFTFFSPAIEELHCQPASGPGWPHIQHKKDINRIFVLVIYFYCCVFQFFGQFLLILQLLKVRKSSAHDPLVEKRCSRPPSGLQNSGRCRQVVVSSGMSVHGSNI